MRGTNAKKAIQFLLITAIILPLVFLIVGLFVHDPAFSDRLSDYGTLASCICFALALFVIVVFWRCPVCGERYPIVGLLNIEKCPNCHARLK